MGFVKSDLAEKNQNVKGVIIGLEDDIKLTRALSVTSNIEFYKYKVNFKLFKLKGYFLFYYFSFIKIFIS